MSLSSSKFKYLMYDISLNANALSFLNANYLYSISSASLYDEGDFDCESW